MSLFHFIQERATGLTAVTLAAALTACGGGGGSGGDTAATTDIVTLRVAATPQGATSQIPGALFTTAAPVGMPCNPVNVNLYDLKVDVYLNGGPANTTGGGMLSAGLPPNTSFYVKVTSPQGTLLGTSVGNSGLAMGSDTPVTTDGTGKFVNCPRLWDIVHKPDNTQGYDNTPNPGGEYKVWISLNSDFTESKSKTDNFKVKEGDDGGGGGIESTGAVTLRKWYDANANGVWDEPTTAEITGWKVSLTSFDPAFTPWDFIGLTLLDMVAREYRPVQANWYPTGSQVNGTPFNVQGSDPTYLNTVPVSVPDLNATAVVTFGNVCLGAGGGHTLGYWSNKNGQALITSSGTTLKTDIKTLLVNLNLVKGTDLLAYVYDPVSYTDLRSWLLNANAVNMAYMLSAQMAAMALNVQTGFVSGSAMVYAPGVIGANFAGFISINDLLTAANNTLGDAPITRAGYPLRSYQELVKNALDNANNNLNFVQPTACSFSFPVTP